MTGSIPYQRRSSITADTCCLLITYTDSFWICIVRDFSFFATPRCYVHCVELLALPWGSAVCIDHLVRNSIHLYSCWYSPVPLALADDS